MNEKHLIIVLAILVSLVLVSPAQAAGTGVYLGGGIGQVTLEDDFSSAYANFREKDTSYRLFGGYRLGLLPILDLAAEAGYRDFGNPGKTIAGQSFDLDMTGYDLSALVIFPIGPIDLLLKGGMLRYDLDASFAGEHKSYSGTAPVFGAGIGTRVWKIGLRADYELADVDEVDDTTMFWLSVYYTF